MEQKDNNQRITIVDNINFKDGNKLIQKNNCETKHDMADGNNIVINESPVKGFVEVKRIDKNGNIISHDGRHNLVVYRGRSYILSRMFNTPIHNSGDTANMQDKFISYFGIGSGGAADYGFTPNKVEPTDVDLIIPGDISGLEESKFVESTTGRTYRKLDDIGNGVRVQYFIEDEIKNNAALWSTMTTNDPNNPKRNSHLFDDVTTDGHLVAKIDVTLTADDANNSIDPNATGLEDGQQFINELGLYVAPENLILNNTVPEDSNFQLFAKVNRPTIVKDSTSGIIFSWYLFF